MTTVSFSPTPDIYPAMTQTGTGSEMGAKLQIVFNTTEIIERNNCGQNTANSASQIILDEPDNSVTDMTDTEE